ncbi:MAG: TniQ family protein [Parasporobacterium sp.]|nr:TniQ family protein [Parasporobacterium sp.]
MPIIPLIIYPETDELMISYLWRLSVHNGVADISDFLHGYIWPNNELRMYKKQQIRIDANNVFPDFFKAIDLPVDPVQFYHQHTIYSGLVPLTTKGWQMQNVTYAFHNEKHLNGLINDPVNMFDGLKICPFCKQEDIDRKGFWYFHTKHHMPGVTMCSKHNVPLHEMIKTSKKVLPAIKPFDAGNKYSEITEKSPEWAYHYAVFASALLEAKIDTDISKVNKAILNTLKNRGLYENTDLLLKYLHDMRCNTMSDDQALRSIKTRMHGGSKPSILQTLSFLALCFPNVVELSKALDVIPEDQAESKRFIECVTGRYDIIGDFYKPLLEMERRDTGERFLTTHRGFIYGWRENSADINKSIKDKYLELFNNASDPSYHLMSEFQGMGQKVSVLHDVCGKEYQINAKSFLIDERRCTCERSYTPEEAKRAVERHPGFTLIKYPIGMYKPCTFLHEYCGNTFENTLAGFLINPKCRRCEMIKDHSEENIEQVVKDLVGDEYTVIRTEGKAKGNLTLRHNVCGRENTYLSRQFTEGSRCPYCNNFAKDKNFRRYVDETTGGKYKIGRRLNNRSWRYEIIDTDTDEIKIFTRNRIIQELSRPTPSPVLPLEQKFPSQALMTHQDIIWAYLTERYGPDDFICSYEFPEFDGISPKSMFVEIGLLCTRKKKLFRVFTGRYSIYAFKDVKLTPKEITEIFFIKRNGVRHGFICGKSLAYELGIISDKPVSTYIATNTRNGKYKRIPNGKGLDVTVKGLPVLITEENYRILQFIDLCYSAKLYRWTNAHDYIVDFANRYEVSAKKVKKYIPYYNAKVQDAVKSIIEEMKL